jgi:Cysteine-rich CWC
MCLHEQKYCPRCNLQFECKAGSINLCQCSNIYLNEEEKGFIARQFEDCLCINCLRQLKEKFIATTSAATGNSK